MNRQLNLSLGFLLFILISLFVYNKRDELINIRDADSEYSEIDYPNFYFFDDRNYPDKSFNYKNFLKRKKEAADQLFNRTGGEWITQGPGNIGGRINAIAIHPYNDSIMYIGFSHGGVFKTINKGSNWFPIFDNEITLSIAHIEIDKKDPEKIWVGTGDKNISGYPFAGTGVYFSQDGGENWESMGLEGASVISKIVLSEQNSNVIYAAAMGLPFEKNNERGLYKSTDAGKNWQQILHVSDSTGIIDLVVHPEDDQILYAGSWNRVRNNAVSIIDGTNTGIHRSYDGGESWELLDVGIDNIPVSRVSLHLNKDNPNIVIAGFVGQGDSTFCSSTTHQLQGIYRSDDAGDNWYPIPTMESNGLDCQALAGFGWYFEPVRVNPDNPDDIFLLGVDLWRTKDGGNTWNHASPVWWTYEVHADKHDLQFNQSGEMILATDGGLYISDIESEEWSDLENIPATQFYRVAYNPHDSDTYYGGAQDNGSTGGNQNDINNWDRIHGGDGFQMIFHPEDPEIFYVETQNGNIRVTTDGGENFMGANKGLDGASYRNWDMPYIMSAFDPNILYTGTYRIFRNSTGPDEQWDPISEDLTKGELIGGGRYPSVTTLFESPLNPEILYAGTNDGNVWVSTDGGLNWTKCTGLPDRYVTDIKCSPYQESWAYVCFSGYRDNDNNSRIYRTKDFGQNWESISGDLLDIAVNDIYILENNFDNILFAGTDVGVFISQSEGDHWERLGTNMPLVPVYDLEYNKTKNQLIAGTFARGIMTFSLDQLDIGSEISPIQTTQSGAHWNVFPAITHDRVNISTDSQQPMLLELINANGSVIKKEQLTGSLEIDLHVLAPGTYFIRLENHGTKKIIKI